MKSYQLCKCATILRLVSRQRFAPTSDRVIYECSMRQNMPPTRLKTQKRCSIKNMRRSRRSSNRCSSRRPHSSAVISIKHESEFFGLHSVETEIYISNMNMQRYCGWCGIYGYRKTRFCQSVLRARVKALTDLSLF